MGNEARSYLSRVDPDGRDGDSRDRKPTLVFHEICIYTCRKYSYIPCTLFYFDWVSTQMQYTVPGSQYFSTYTVRHTIRCTRRVLVIISAQPTDDLLPRGI